MDFIKLMKMKGNWMINDKAISRTKCRPRKNGARSNIDRDSAGVTSAIFKPFLIVLMWNGMGTTMGLLMGRRIGRLIWEALTLIGRTRRV